MNERVPWPAESVEVVPIGELKANPRNSRNHPKAQVRGIADLLLEFGWTFPVLRDEEGVLIAGHGRMEAAALLVGEGHRQFAEAPAITAKGWTDAQKRAYIIADNQIATKAGWNSGILAEELQALKVDAFDMRLLGFGQVELRKLMAADQGEGPDLTPPPPAVPVTRPGDLWTMGGHRMLCGDATVSAHVHRLTQGNRPVLTLTDPPYCSGGFQEAGKSSGSIGARQVKAGKAHAGGIANDKLSTRGYLQLMRTTLATCPTDLLYAFTDWRMWLNLFDVTEGAGYGVRNMIVWDKETPGMGRGWRSQHELVLFGAKAAAAFLPKFAQGNVITCKRTGNTHHPTQKPVDLLAKILAVTTMADSVYDPFTGSGSTLIACQQEGREFRGMELGAAYVDVTVRRWEHLTGENARLEGSGETFASRKAAMESDDSAAWT